jgi:Protein-disulfide isomerase
MNPEPQSKSSSILVPIAIILAGAMVAVAVYFTGGGPVKNPNQAEEEKIVLTPVSAEDHILGNPLAEVVVVEYSDFECPFCKVFHNTMHQIVSEYGDKVAWVFRHMPIPELHAKAKKEAEASECAAEQGGNTIFWKYADKIFEITKGNDSLDPSELPKIALGLGLDVEKFNSCLSSGKYTQVIENSIKQADKDGIPKGTPYSIIISKDGKQIPIRGAAPIEEMRIRISEALAN